MESLKDIEWVDDVKNSSPLELAKKLEQIEMFDEKSSRQVVDEIYKEFETNQDIEDNVLIPIFSSIVDGLMEVFPATRKLREKGLTPSRIVNECKNFNYNAGSSETVDGYSEWKNMQETTKSDFEEYAENVRHSGDNRYYDDGSKDDYKENKFSESSTINIEDEYTGEKNVYQYQKNEDGSKRVDDYKFAHQAHVDHIVPLSRVVEQLKGNYALTEKDITNIANCEENFAITSAHINNGSGMAGKGRKGDMTNAEFVEDQNRREREGRPNQQLSAETKETMLRKGEEAQETINRKANEAIGKNLIGQGTGNTEEIWAQTTSNALGKSKDYAIGNVVLYLLKPLYYEISDIIRNGLKKGVNASSSFEALKIRFVRVKNYVRDTAWKFLKDNVWEFVKNVISSLIEGIISLFVGFFKQILKIIKEGIKLFVKSAKILFGEESKNKTMEKGDAILKLVGGSIIAISGVGIEFLLNRIGIGEPWSIVISTILSGTASALFVYVLEKIDLFNVRAERRLNRIREIFQERINDIAQRRDDYNKIALETMYNQQRQFNLITDRINVAYKNRNSEELVSNFYKLAEFMRVDIPYKTRTEFVEYMNSDEEIVL